MNNRSKGKKRKKVKFNPLKLAVTLTVAVMLIVAGLKVKNIVSLHLEKKALLEHRAELIAEKNIKKNELKNVNDLDYIEEQARRQLKMIKPGEVLYILDEKDSSSENHKNANDEEE